MSSKELEDLKAEDIIALSVDDVVRAVSQLGQDSPCLICKNPDHSLVLRSDLQELRKHPILRSNSSCTPSIGRKEQCGKIMSCFFLTKP